MNSKTYKQLTVYKASAGSGKTFTLALEYIKLLISNPYCFRNILAVTFTNKATEEMKNRILYFLYGLASDLNDSDVVTFRELLKDGTGFDDKMISTNAHRAMNLIIHNYTYFNIETIDSFFQRVLNNMAKELGLTAGLRLELDDEQVEEMAVDKIVDSMDRDEDLLEWITEFIFDNIDNEKGWNVIRDIKKFGKVNFKNDEYHRNREDLNVFMSEEGGKRRKDFIRSLQNEMKEAKKMTAAFKKEYNDALAANGFDEKLFSYTTIPNYFKLLDTGKPYDIYQYYKDKAAIKYFTEGTSGDDYVKCIRSKERPNYKSFVENVLAGIVKRSFEALKTAVKMYSNASLTYRNFYKLALLDRIEKKIREINNETNSFLLSYTQDLLSEFIEDGDSPFIYEKTGSFLEHIMIDEFQDTATKQWRNFNVLLNNCMANSSNKSRTINNMLVGDVKQSIYRWRNGDWRILNDMRGDDTREIVSLDTNFRSQKTIIDFNNRFFKFAAEAEKAREDRFRSEAGINCDERISTDNIVTAYSDVCQKVNKKGDNGYVRITLLKKASSKKSKKEDVQDDKEEVRDDYTTATIKLVEDEINELLDKGARQNDIAILVRKNTYIPQIAEYFSTDKRINIVSNEAFRLDASVSVNIIIAVLRLLSNPDDNISKAYLVKTYNEDVLKNEEPIDDFLSDRYLPEDFTNRLKKISLLPVTDMLDAIYDMFELGKVECQDAFICALYDKINDFVNKNSADIDAILEEWDNSMYKTTIQGSSADGIRIMSFHKSKGLEFENVIIPFCDWELKQKTHHLLWCKPTEGFYKQLPVVPIECNDDIMRSMYAPYYIDESIQNNVDNLNLLYVAFTRAGRNLFVIGKKDEEKRRSNVIQAFIDNDAEKDENRMVFEVGTLTDIVHEKEKKVISKNKFKQQSEPLPIKLLPGCNKAVFRQSNASKDFMADGPEDVRSECLDRGKILHQMMASIATAEDTDRVISEFKSQGLLEDADDIRKALHEMMTHDMISSWFDGSWKLFNECDILMKDTDGRLKTCRPDRVMMKKDVIVVADYKTGEEYDSYHDQVRRYMKILNSMYPGKVVRGYLLYLDKTKVVEVK